MTGDALLPASLASIMTMKRAYDSDFTRRSAATFLSLSLLAIKPSSSSRSSMVRIACAFPHFQNVTIRSLHSDHRGSADHCPRSSFSDHFMCAYCCLASLFSAASALPE
jgi:hypothetical protein